MIVALVMVVRFGVVVRDVLTLDQAARVGVRAAAITTDETEVIGAIREAAELLDEDRIEISFEPPLAEARKGELVRVRLDHVVRVEVPFLSSFLDIDLPLKAEASMLSERDPP